MELTDLINRMIANLEKQEKKYTRRSSSKIVEGKEIVKESMGVATPIVRKISSRFWKELKQLGITKAVIASGPIIIKNKKMLVVLDDKDPFLKFPGGSIFKNKTLKETCKIETIQEIRCKIEIIKELEPIMLWKKPHTGEKIPVVLIHWLAKLKNCKPKKGKHTKEIFWIDSKYKGHKLAPNVKYFLKKLKKEKKIN